ncbi:MAG: 30S ribosomal protein S1 [Acidobacteria bacterium]|nr:30S ribosomal protein S1 [Acidobacteriota bacterium]
MSNPPETKPAETTESFDQIFSQYEKDHARPKTQDGPRQIDGTVISITADSVLLDIGFKTEGMLPLTAFAGETVKPGDKLLVSVKGRDPEGYYELSRFKIAQPTDWSSLQQAFAAQATIVGRVTGVVKGGLSVDVGVRAFMPASRSGTRDAAEMEKLVGQEITCRIIKLEVEDEDVVVDHRVVAEEEERVIKDRRFADLKEGDLVRGEVRSLADYGAFVDIGGVDGLLHVSDIAWSRVQNPADLLAVGQKVEAKILKIDPEKRRISLGLKQLQAHPWDAAAAKYKTGERVRGSVTRIVEFGAFVELEPGVEGLIHISEMAWSKVKKASDVVKTGETVEAVILGVNPAERRISLGLKQALGDPWVEAAGRFSAGSQVEGAITRFTKFGAFVQLSEGVEGLIHISEISPDKHIHHPQDVLKLGERVKVLVLAVDKEKRQLKLSIKQLVPSSLDEYIAERKAGDTVSGRVIEVSGAQARVELGEGIQAACRLSGSTAEKEENQPQAKADLSSLTSMLQARWKGGAASSASKPEPLQAGQIRSFRITRLDADAKKIEVELA